MSIETLIWLASFIFAYAFSYTKGKHSKTIASFLYVAIAISGINIVDHPIVPIIIAITALHCAYHLYKRIL